ncbi:PDZ domain-containing protein [Candidatus Woesearchaeota archaeon]|nr:PDZ domain-containing protein [Candidatus Woesearchaeota archaeon]
MNIKSIFKSWRVWVLIIVILLSLVAIGPNFGAKGVKISAVEENSSASLSGVVAGETIVSINNQQIKDINDYQETISEAQTGDIVKIRTKDNSYSFLIEEKNNLTYTGITVDEVASSNIQTGLDLSGGVRVLLKPEEKLSQQQMEDVITITKKRLNIYGLSDIVVRKVGDLEGNDYILIEIASATKEEVVDLLEKQGKFEAKIANETVFVGGKDIKQVCRSAECSGVRTCDKIQDGWQCQFQFQVGVSPEAAKKHAKITEDLDVELVKGSRYLSEKLNLYLDNELVDSLYISANLKGSESTSFVIQGPGIGSTKDAALQNSLDNMKKLQTVLITGSLPVKLNIAKMDIVSPTLGREFLKSSLLAIIAAIGAVGIVVFVRYRKLKIALPIVLTGFAEVLIILGVAAAIRWNLDLAAIAAILAAVGTGVDDQIVITDEVSSKQRIYDWKERIKRAFFIIMAAYFTVVVAMIPLWAMGAGLLKGFAIITIIGVSIGVFVTRPAYAHIIKALLKE